MNKLRMLLDPFILMLVGAVVLASVLPARGGFVPVVGIISTIGIVLLFFFHGAKLSRAAIIAGASNWRLHLAILAATYGLFPLLGLVVAQVPLTPPLLASGLLYLTLLPSTAMSSVALTAMARGNVAAALCGASFSNLAGIFLTPMLVLLTMGGTGSGASWQNIEEIGLQMLLPFALGHMLRPWIGDFVQRRRTLVTAVDRGAVLMVVYSAFGAAVVAGLWHHLSAGALAIVTLVCCVLLALVLGITALAGRAMGLSREDRIVLLFCGSKKSLATGAPMASILFARADLGFILLPIMLFHQIQLIVCALIAQHYASEDDARRAGAA
ncbi:MAG: bile acid:sodium symporter [Sphingobium sp. 32-64-5]|nr:MAG: bile acid:sodium symporter [Sphingobium sp. 32-64-5]